MDSEESRRLFFRCLCGSLAAGFLASIVVVIFYLMFFAVPVRGLIAATGLSFAGIFIAVLTGPWSLIQILMGIRGSYYAFWTAAFLILYAGAVFAQIKYLPRMLLALVAGFDLMFLIFGLWMARLIVA